MWGTAASALAIASGLVSGSLLLIAFGAVGLLDVAGSVVLVVHFRHAVHHEEVSAARERRALLAIAIGMTVIAAATLLESAHRLVGHHTAEGSLVGSVTAATSVIALTVLSAGKQRSGSDIGSRALVADGHVSAMGACFGALALGGAVSTATLDWWWMDPAGSLVVALVAVAVAIRHATANEAPDYSSR